MSILQNMEYNKVLSTVLMGTSLAMYPLSASNDHSNITLTQKASYDSFIDYTSPLQSTHYSLLKNDTEMLKVLELEEIKEAIYTEFNAHVQDIWIPADGQLEKTCVFLSLLNQDELVVANNDLELDMYHKVEYILNKSQFFNMIALM